jgi:hypothetical protein
MTMNPTYLSKVAISAVLLGCTALVPRQDPSGGKGGRADGLYTASVTLFVAANQEMNADGLTSVLQNQRFLNSIGTKLACGGEDSARETPELAFVSIEPVASELVSISVVSTKRELAKSGLTALLEAIPKLEPESIANAKRDAADAEANYVKSAAALQAARAAQEKWVSQNGPVEPSAYLEREKERLVQYTQELSQVQFDVATQLSLRDFLKERLAGEPAEVETRRTIPNARRMLLERQLESVANAQSPTADPAKFLEAQLKTIEAIEKQLSAGGMSDKEVVEKAPNARRGEIETQLFETERSIADMKSREAALAKACDTLGADTIRLWRLNGEWEAIQEAWNRAFQTNDQARGALEQAQQNAKSTMGNPWYRIVAGPRFD